MMRLPRETGNFHELAPPDKKSQELKGLTAMKIQHGIRKTSSRGAQNRSGGSTIIEFALVVPVFLALMIGIMEFGWLVKVNHTIANATREGARAASLGKTAADTRTRVRSASLPTMVTDDQITLTYYNTTTNTWTAWPAEVAGKNGVPVDTQVKVEVRVPHQSLTGFFPFMRNRAVTQLTVMRREL